MYKQLFFLLLAPIFCAHAFLVDVPRRPFAYPAFSYLPEQQSQFGTWSYAILPKASASVGIYVAWPYIFPATYAGVIELAPDMLLDKLPTTLENTIKAATQKTYAHYIQDPANKVYAFIVVAPFLKQNNAIASVYNVVYHFFYELIAGKQRFAANMLMGLFEPMNIVGTDANGIPLNRFGQMHMSTHPEGGPYAVSPNNATFRVDTSKQVASGWLAALAPNKKQLSITYLVMVPEDIILPVVQQINSIGSITHWLTVLQNMADAVQGTNRAQFLAAVATIKNLLSKQPQGPNEVLLLQLQQLLKQLDALNIQLQML